VGNPVPAVESTVVRYQEMLRELLGRPPVPFDEDLRSALPTAGGVYRILEKAAGWQSSVYVGKSGNLRRRVYSYHFMGDRRVSTLKRKLIKSGLCANEDAVKEYFSERCSVQFLLVDEHERGPLEHFAVAILRPRYND